MPSLAVLQAVPYDIALSTCRVGTKHVCKFHGLRGSNTSDPFVKPSDLPENQRKLYERITGSICVCMKGNELLRQQAEKFTNPNDNCEGYPRK